MLAKIGRVFSRTIKAEDFIQAARDGNLAIVREYLATNRNNNAAGVSIFHNCANALIEACDYNQTETVLVLLASALNINTNVVKMGYTALMWAAQNGNLAIVQALLAYGVDWRQFSKAAQIARDNHNYSGQHLVVADLLAAEGERREKDFWIRYGLQGSFSMVARLAADDKLAAVPQRLVSEQKYDVVANASTVSAAENKLCVAAVAAPPSHSSFRSSRAYLHIAVPQLAPESLVEAKHTNNSSLPLLPHLAGPTFEQQLDAVEYDWDNLPPAYEDLFTGRIINYPIAFPTGQTFDKKSLLDYFAVQQKVLKNPDLQSIRCPYTDVEISKKDLYESKINITLRAAFEIFVKAEVDAYKNKKTANSKVEVSPAVQPASQSSSTASKNNGPHNH